MFTIYFLLYTLINLLICKYFKNTNNNILRLSLSTIEQDFSGPDPTLRNKSPKRTVAKHESILINFVS